MNIETKTAAATGGSALGGALVAIGLYFAHDNPPPDVVAAMCLVASSVCALIGGYFAPHTPQDKGVS